MTTPAALQCKKCKAMWTRRTVLDDTCSKCGGDILDITGTHIGQEFLRSIAIPVEIRLTKENAIYATGPSTIFSAAPGKLS